MRFEINLGETIEVRSNDKIFMIGRAKNIIRFHWELYKDDKLIFQFERSLFSFIRKVKIKYQSLPLPITFAKYTGLFKFLVRYNEHEILIKQNLFSKSYFRIYLNSEEVATVQNPKKMIIGSSKYIITSDLVDENQNLYLILSFLMQLTGD